MTEWREVLGTGGRYHVSSDGQVRGPRKLLRPVLRKGYPRVDIGGEALSIHRLVLEAFVGPAPAGHEARHLDGDKGNARLTNLAWGTPADNAADRARHGTQLRGERVAVSKLSEGIVREIRQSTLSHNEVAAAHGVSRGAVRKVRSRATWRHVA